ncbi:type II toxin-antitoxin system RelE/ParE family toxin [bacterium]|nr:type II toxin-antitoxin system RelE/ParE family toxin [bacterium]
MSFRVQIASNAKRDVYEIAQYIRSQDSTEAADHVVNKIQETAQSLSEHPKRGAIPDSLQALGEYRFRMIHFKPYQIYYTVEADRVIVRLVVDGRRDLNEILEKRLLK